MFWSVEQVLLIKEERDLLEIGSLNLQVATSSAQFLLRQFTQTERKRLGTFNVVFFEIKINDGLSREREREAIYIANLLLPYFFQRSNNIKVILARSLLHFKREISLFTK